MNILVLSESPRKGSNRDLMVNGFVNATTEPQNVEIISVLAPCISYNACYFILYTCEMLTTRNFRSVKLK